MIQLMHTLIAATVCLSSPGRTKTLKGNNMNDKHAKKPRYPSSQFGNALIIFFVTFVLSKLQQVQVGSVEHRLIPKDPSLYMMNHSLT